MRTITKLFILLVVLTSCTDNLGLKSPINIHLDKEIETKISILSNTGKISNSRDKIELIGIQKIISDIDKIKESINIYDGSRQITEEADNYFSDLAIKMKADNNIFIRLSELHDKPDIILAIKINEITCLDRILLD